MLEKNLERFMYASRWLLAPVYLGMSMALLILAVKFFQEVRTSCRISWKWKTPI